MDGESVMWIALTQSGPVQHFEPRGRATRGINRVACYIFGIRGLIQASQITVRTSSCRSLKTVVRFLTVGVLNTCVGLGIIYLCMYLLRLGNVAANIIGYAAGIAFSFTLNKRWTFANDGRSGPQLLRFLLVCGAAYVANLAVVMICIDTLAANRYLSQAIGIVPYTVIGYLGSRFFVFRQYTT